MKADVLKWSEGRTPSKLISKETLNHRGLIEMVTGLNVYHHTLEAYRGAYRALGIDLINRVPLENAPRPAASGTVVPHPSKPYVYAPLGVFDTAIRTQYECASVEDVWNLNMNEIDCHALITPVPHPCKAHDIQARQLAVNNLGIYYPMLYTTLFMWGVEVLGWEIFLLAAQTEPYRFFKHFLEPCIEKTCRIVEEIAYASESPFVFLHDDLADKNGPIFHPAWYDEYIFPYYPLIFERAKKFGKKVIFVADGNMAPFLPKLHRAGADGIMFENPATPLDAVIDTFGQKGCYFIGGIDTAVLTCGKPEEVESMVMKVYKKCGKYPGFAIASCGGIHGNVPIENLVAYFDARARIGATPRSWRTIAREDKS